MQFKKTVAALALAGTAIADGRPNGTSICDYYTTALLKDNNSTNQATLLTLLVNTAVIGNYTKPKIEGVTWPDVAVNGILNKGTVNGTEVNLLPYFNGGLLSSNRGKPVAINFLDDGGAAPLMMNMPANGTSSNQYKLLTHLYEFFGTLLGCSQQGMKGFDSYNGQASMFAVHKYMDLDYAQMTYFIEQVALSAASFGVAMSDIQDVGKALNGAFNYRCSPMITLAPALGSQLQSICIAPDCPADPKADCSLYPEAVMPAVANSTLAMGEGNSSATASGSMASSTGGSSSGGSAPMSSSISQAGADHIVGSTMATFLGFLAFLL